VGGPCEIGAAVTGDDVTGVGFEGCEEVGEAEFADGGLDGD
jgi:hypothetical protein